MITFRIGRTEFFLERLEGLVEFRHWHLSTERIRCGRDLLFWVGPLHLAVSNLR